MSYSENIAHLVAEQIERFVTLNRHQLAAHVANLEFWIGEIRHALAIVDGYQARFRRLKETQDAYVAAHSVTVTSPVDPEMRHSPDSPRRVDETSLRDARKALTEATYRFLVRLHRDGMIDEHQLRTICVDLGIGVDPSDLKRRRP